jgi:ATP-binding cassette subfamily C (CFTR/MRP) protein 1
MVAQFAQNEQNMNAVERVLVYTELPPEDDGTSSDVPPPSWPDKGEVKFSNVELAYRKGLPLVLKDVTFQVRPGEKVLYHFLFGVAGTHVCMISRWGLWGVLERVSLRCTPFYFLTLMYIFREELFTAGFIPVSWIYLFLPPFTCADSRFSMVELHGGNIDIDGQNISQISMYTLRSSLALVPQDTTLFLGTLRENL